MIYTKEKFKELWDSDRDGGGLKMDDIVDCAKYWRLYDTPELDFSLDLIVAVTEAANCES